MRKGTILVMSTVIMSVLYMLCFAAAVQAASPGELIKLPDDGNPETTRDSAVYYVGPDGKRYVFPNSRTYFTWYENFDSVKVVSEAELAAIPIGGNVTYRPGTRMVKIISAPDVYAVEPGGTLRWVQTEEIARTLYGTDWNQRIDDIPTAFFVNYSVGAPLAASFYPVGSVVRRTGDDAYFRIEGMTKRRIASAEARTALRLQERHVLETSSDLSGYADGPDITGAETALTDTSQREVVAPPSPPTLAVRQPDSSYIPVAGDAALLELHLTSGSAVTLKKLTVRIEATTDEASGEEVDDDEGGLVFGNNAQPNLRLIRFVDGAGIEVFGRKELAVDVNQDQAQTFVFTGTLSIPAGSENVLYLRAQLNGLLPEDEGYRVKVLSGGLELVGAGSGQPAAWLPGGDLTGPTLKTLSDSLEITVSSNPGDVDYVRGAVDVPISGFTFQATTAAPNIVRSIEFRGYIDEHEGNGIFNAGSDADNGTATEVRQMLPQVSLHDADGARLAGPVAVELDGRVLFSGLELAIPAGQSRTYILRGGLVREINLEQSANRLAFDIDNGPQDVTVTDDQGNGVNVVGLHPNRGTTPTYYATVNETGEVDFSWGGSGGYAVAGREIQLGKLTVETEHDAYMLRTLTFRDIGSSRASLGSELSLKYKNATGQSVTRTATFAGDIVTFANLEAPLAKDAVTDFTLHGQLFTKSGGAVAGEQIKIRFGDTDALEFVSASTGVVYDNTDLGSAEFVVSKNAPSGWITRFSLLAAAKASDSPSGEIYRSSVAEVFKFTLGAEPEGAVRIKKLTFKIDPADAGTVGADNDSLERWAKVNGDFADDDGIVNLKWGSGTDETLIGEDAQTRIMYSVVQGGAKDTTPEGLVSTNADYGLIEYVFNDGSELFIAAGSVRELTLELDISLFDGSSNHTLAIELLGSGDLQWTDIPSGNYTPLSGSVADGLPVVGNSLLVRQ